jgi:hypothetical protein
MMPAIKYDDGSTKYLAAFVLDLITDIFAASHGRLIRLDVFIVKLGFMMLHNLPLRGSGLTYNPYRLQNFSCTVNKPQK